MKIQLPQTTGQKQNRINSYTPKNFSAIAPNLVDVSLFSVVRQLKTADMIPLRIILSTERHNVPAVKIIQIE